MTPDTPAQDNTSTPLTVDAAAGKFLSLLTPPKEHENEQEPKPEAESEGPPAPAESPEDVAGADAEAETQPDETPPASELYDIPVGDGKVERITLDELKKGYLRERDYTQKRQADAELERQLQAEVADVRAKRQTYAERLTAIEEALKDLDKAEPDAATLDKLRKENPAEYAAVRADLQAQRDRKNAVQAEKDRVRREEQAEQAKLAEARFIEERDKLLAAVPEWKDPAKAEAASRDIIATAQQYGFGGTDIAAGLHDHRIVLLLRDAAAYRQLKAKVPDTKKKVEALKTATPGAQRTPDRGAGEKKALERLSQSGKQSDAAAAFLERSKQRA